MTLSEAVKSELGHLLLRSLEQAVQIEQLQRQNIGLSDRAKELEAKLPPEKDSKVLAWPKAAAHVQEYPDAEAVPTPPAVPPDYAN